MEEEAKAVEVYEKLLIVIVDANPFIWGHVGDPTLDDELLQSLTFSHMLDCLLLYLNAHIMMHPYNSCAVLACNSTGSTFLYPVPNAQQPRRPEPGEPYEQFAQMDKIIAEQLRAMVAANGDDSKASPYTMLASAWCRALCYIQRLDKEMPPGRGLKARILVMYASHDNAMQYMAVMNAIFMAQKKKVPVDACVLGSKPSGFLQQACALTDGLYVQVANGNGLLEYLMTMLLPGQDDRTMLRLPRGGKIDYRAACFCHNRVVHMGYVCSVCLSIFCEPRGVCTTCHSRFKVHRFGHSQSAIADSQITNQP